MNILIDENSTYVGKAQWFISHAWKYNFLEAITIMEEFFQKEVGEGWEDTIIWFDLICNSQHSTESKPFSWWANEFSTHLGLIGNILILSCKVDPSIYNSEQSSFQSYCFRRSWCVFEYYSSVKIGCRIEIAMASDDESNLSLQARSNSRRLFTDIRKLINLRTAEAYQLTDKTNIQAVIESSIGYEAVEWEVYSSLMKVFLRKLGMYDKLTVPNKDQQCALDIIIRECFESINTELLREHSSSSSSSCSVL